MLASSYRFHGHRSLTFLFRNGQVARTKLISLKYVHNPRRAQSRCAVVVGRKVSKSAPVRNRIRRRVYETVRGHWDELLSGYDMAFFIYDASVAELPAAEVTAAVLQLLDEAHIRARL